MEKTTQALCVPENRLGRVDWFITDHLGSTKLLIDQNGQHRFTGDDDPFGINLRSFGDKDSHRYTGQVLDEEEGVYYFGARYYLPDIGRFISGDPLCVNHSLYTYAHNNPIHWIDPDGMAEKPSESNVPHFKVDTEWVKTPEMAVRHRVNVPSGKNDKHGKPIIIKKTITTKIPLPKVTHETLNIMVAVIVTEQSPKLYTQESMKIMADAIFNRIGAGGFVGGVSTGDLKSHLQNETQFTGPHEGSGKIHYQNYMENKTIKSETLMKYYTAAYEAVASLVKLSTDKKDTIKGPKFNYDSWKSLGATDAATIKANQNRFHSGGNAYHKDRK